MGGRNSQRKVVSAPSRESRSQIFRGRQVFRGKKCTPSPAEKIPATPMLGRGTIMVLTC